VLSTCGSTMCCQRVVVRCVANVWQYDVLSTCGSTLCCQRVAVRCVANVWQYSVLPTCGSTLCCQRVAVLCVVNALLEHTSSILGTKLIQDSQHFPPAQECAGPPASKTSTTYSLTWLHVLPKRLKHERVTHDVHKKQKTEPSSALKR